MRLSITLQPQPGDSIEALARELQTMSDRWGITCETKFKDVRLVAHTGGIAQNLVDGYWDWTRSPTTVKLAFSTRRLSRDL